VQIFIETGYRNNFVIYPCALYTLSVQIYLFKNVYTFRMLIRTNTHQFTKHYAL